MAKRVFFSFHYSDVIDFRANVVRKHWVTKDDREAAGFFDASIWETAKKTSDLAVKRLINSEIKNTSNTCVLIGSETYNRRWVRYEIIKSMAKGNHLLGVHINSIKGRDEKTKILGYNPFDYLGYRYSEDGTKLTPLEWKNNKWIDYKDFDTYSLKTTVSEAKRGKSFKLSGDYKVYNWVLNNGFQNFSNWLK